jgi:hypothetical protein
MAKKMDTTTRKYKITCRGGCQISTEQACQALWAVLGACDSETPAESAPSAGTL